MVAAVIAERPGDGTVNGVAAVRFRSLAKLCAKSRRMRKNQAVRRRKWSAAPFDRRTGGPADGKRRAPMSKTEYNRGAARLMARAAMEVCGFKGLRYFSMFSLS